MLCRGGPGPILCGVSSRVAGLAPCPVGLLEPASGTARWAGGEGAAGVGPLSVFIKTHVFSVYQGKTNNLYELGGCLQLDCYYSVT